MNWEETSAPTIPSLFAACDGIRFYGPKDELFTIRAGVYGNGSGALAVMAEDGQMECKLTVNLGGVVNESTVRKGPLNEDEFYVKVDEVGRIERFVLDTGFFEQTGYYADVSNVRRYADLWRFAATCPHGGKHRVICSHCRGKYERTLADKKTRLDAREATARLRNVKRGAW